VCGKNISQRFSLSYGCSGFAKVSKYWFDQFHVATDTCSVTFSPSTFNSQETSEKRIVSIFISFFFFGTYCFALRNYAKIYKSIFVYQTYDATHLAWSFLKIMFEIVQSCTSPAVIISNNDSNIATPAEIISQGQTNVLVMINLTAWHSHHLHSS
jgi:hypothetical protein